LKIESIERKDVNVRRSRDVDRGGNRRMLDRACLRLTWVGGVKRGKNVERKEYSYFIIA
jgi:hypothetical protein